MTRVLVALLTVCVLLAGCAGPSDGGDEDEPEFTDSNRTETTEGAGTPTPDNDAGAEPVNPPDDQNRTNATSPEATDEADGNQSG